LTEVLYTVDPVSATEPVERYYTGIVSGLRVSVIVKANGGKGDALNAGINYCATDYFVALDADSQLQCEAIGEIVKPVMANEHVSAVGGMVLVSQYVRKSPADAEGGGPTKPVKHKISRNFLAGMQSVEYSRSFFASRMLLDTFDGNLIISGAFGLFKKSTVFSIGGYARGHMGEDMDLVMKVHSYAAVNRTDDETFYQPGAICFTQAPHRLRELVGQRRRWCVGLLQSLTQHKHFTMNADFGMKSFFSYVYYWLYELLAPVIQVFGMISMLAASYFGILNWRYMLTFLTFYVIFGALITAAAFTQVVHLQNARLTVMELGKALLFCLFELVFFRPALMIFQLWTLLTYRFRKASWGKITRRDEGEDALDDRLHEQPSR
jgi:cellulose synthase/poly-beta-1,6-N-acetylglucosamine synthase-like glycosyltransferase